jgi:hypothetical protein
LSKKNRAAARRRWTAAPQDSKPKNPLPEFDAMTPQQREGWVDRRVAGIEGWDSAAAAKGWGKVAAAYIEENEKRDDANLWTNLGQFEDALRDAGVPEPHLVAMMESARTVADESGGAEVPVVLHWPGGFAVYAVGRGGEARERRRWDEFTEEELDAQFALDYKRFQSGVSAYHDHPGEDLSFAIGFGYDFVRQLPEMARAFLAEFDPALPGGVRNLGGTREPPEERIAEIFEVGKAASAKRRARRREKWISNPTISRS